MSKRSYQSFEEIDRDLKILKLRRAIAAESLKGKSAAWKRRLSPGQWGEGGWSKAALAALLFLLRQWRKSRRG
jgi:hypothetical protein